MCESKSGAGELVNEAECSGGDKPSANEVPATSACAVDDGHGFVVSRDVESDGSGTGECEVGPFNDSVVLALYQ